LFGEKVDRVPIQNPPGEIKLCLVQKPPVFLNTHASVALACQWMDEAAQAGTELMVFPETWLPGYPVWLDFADKAALWDYPPAKALFRILYEQAVSIDDEVTRRLMAKVDETGLHLVMGLHERYGGTLYNTIYYLAPNQPVVLHRKLIPTYTERLIWGRGDGATLNLMETPFGKVGGLVCWEHWMPMARAAMHAQGELIHVAQWPMVKEMNQIASRHYAFEGQCFVAATGCVLNHRHIMDGIDSLEEPNRGAREMLATMKPDSRGYFLRGGSGLIAPNGEYLVPPVYEEDRLIYAELQPHLATEARMFLDTDGHYARPDVFQLQVDTRPKKSVHFGGGEDLPNKKTGKGRPE